jgi:hypothetical protein
MHLFLVQCTQRVKVYHILGIPGNHNRIPAAV